MTRKLIGKNTKIFPNLIETDELQLDETLNPIPKSLAITGVIRTKGGTGEFSQVESLISARKKTKTLVATLNPDSRYTTLGLKQQSLISNDYQNGSAIICEDWMRNDVLNRILKHIEENDVDHLILAVGTGSGGGLLERLKRVEMIADTIYITIDSKINYCVDMKRMLIEHNIMQGERIRFVDLHNQL
ncbi:hypothetical protein [Alcanivorax sp. 1008]|uniref:hypothetical protein n=1 Tax=Alcanivorax sp. 1008 TaxID=2816853 RepID=UPI001D897E80|nr:hypothetical protein [Alcanivorax sp. 1008]MCC1498245.1 hypothetical protein [Alcanivorax sp. 1008]